MSEDPVERAPVVWMTELDFTTKAERALLAGEFPASVRSGRFAWADVGFRDRDEARAELLALGVLHPDAVEDVITGDPETRQARYPEYLHLVLTEVLATDPELQLGRVDVFLGERFLVTIHRGTSPLLDRVRREYRTDFVAFARSPSFLLYEIFDQLLDGYASAQARFERHVDAAQAELMGDAGHQAFVRVSELGANLLNFRKVLSPARTLLTDLSTRKSVFISEATQPFLANMVGTVEHLLQELLVDRDILSESVNLYVSMVGYRTNEVMKRLTVVSVVFLPLTFLVGVYGMNFDVLPELRWRYGYAAFWVAAVVIAVSIVTFMRRARWL